MKIYEVDGHEHSILPDGVDLELVWSDEFDGTELDTSKWDFRKSMMGMEWPAWTDKAVYLDGKGNVVFKVIDEDGRPVSSQLQTGYNFMDTPVEKTKFGEDHLQWNIGKLKENKYTKKYGYFECRCKMQKMDGWWSAFWIQSPNIGSSLDAGETGVEIDVMECFKPGFVQHHNVFTGGYGLDMQQIKVGGEYEIDNPEEFHRYGVLWDENGYTFYVDGKEDGHVDKNVSHRPEFILISTEVQGYRFKDHKPVKEAYDLIGNDEFVVDYVRVFDIKK